MRLKIKAAVAALGFVLAGEALAGDISPQANREYLVNNAKKLGVMVLPSGLQYRVIKSGSGETPTPDDTVTVSYKGAMVDAANKVVSGWQEALSLMKVGDEWELVLPAALGYGENRSGPIPPNQTLVFDLQLVAIAHPKR